jgi:hypothetical protein
MSASSRTAWYEFDFPISYAGPDRAIARELGETLAAAGWRVFYDRFYPGRLLGARLDREFRWVFGGGTRFFVPLVSRHYGEGEWPQLEWRIGKEEAKRREQHFVLPVRLDDTPLLGLPETVGYVDLRQHSVDEVVETLSDKRRAEVMIKGAYLARETWVATFGLVIEDVMEAGVLPESAPEDYPSLCDWLEDDLIRRLREAPISNPRFAEASARTGETLSVRVAFEWVPRRDALSFGELPWWEVLEVLPWGEVHDVEARAIE